LKQIATTWWVRIDKTEIIGAGIAKSARDAEIFDALRHPEYFQKTIEKKGSIPKKKP